MAAFVLWLREKGRHCRQKWLSHETVGAECKRENGHDGNSNRNSSGSASLALAMHLPWAEGFMSCAIGVKHTQVWS